MSIRLTSVQQLGVAELVAILLIALRSACAAHAPGSDDETKEAAFQNRMAARTLADRGFLLAKEGDYQRALTVLAGAIEIDGGYAPARYFRAATRLRMLDYSAAIIDLDIVIELDPNYPAAWNDRGFARRQVGDVAGASNDWDHCIALDPTWALPYANRSEMRYTQGDVAGAIDDFNRALALDPRLAVTPEPALAVHSAARQLGK